MIESVLGLEASIFLYFQFGIDKKAHKDRWKEDEKLARSKGISVDELRRPRAERRGKRYDKKYGHWCKINYFNLTYLI